MLLCTNPDHQGAAAMRLNNRTGRGDPGGYHICWPRPSRAATYLRP